MILMLVNRMRGGELETVEVGIADGLDNHDEDVGLHAKVGNDEELVLDVEVKRDEIVGNDEKARSGEQYKDSSDMSKSDMLRSPIPSYEEDIRTSTQCDVTKRVQFNPANLKNPVLVVGNTFHDVAEFRKVVCQANSVKGKDMEFKKNERKWVMTVCKDIRSKYRVYGRQMKDELTFILISLRPKHTCTRRYKNHMITSTSIHSENNQTCP
jgi:hypothetical protein